MAGVHHGYASSYNKGAPDYETTDHFVAIVGTGTDAQRVFGIYAGHNRLRHIVELAMSSHA